MIKNLFFDLDDTIIKDDKSDAEEYKEALKKYGYNEEDYLDVYVAIDQYERDFTEEDNIYDKKKMIDFINNYMNKNYSYNLMDDLIKAAEKWTKRIILTEDIVSKLSEKYNLYIYTNYFKNSQIKRIETIGYSKYFKKIFSADVYGSKPFKSAFQKILDELGTIPEECMLIGDTKAKDIAAASNIGMKSILYDYNGKRDNKEVKVENYVVIKDMKELLKIL